MLPVRTSLLCGSILVESLVYLSSLHPRFVSLFYSSLLSIFQAYILALRVYFSRGSCLFFELTSLFCEYILVESPVYFSSLHPCFTSLFYFSLLYIFQSYILASRVYFSRFSCIFFNPTSSICESILVCRDRLILLPDQQTPVGWVRFCTRMYRIIEILRGKRAHSDCYIYDITISNTLSNLILDSTGTTLTYKMSQMRSPD